MSAPIASPLALDALRHDGVDFGELPRAVDELLQQGVAAHRSSRARAEALFREALAVAPDALPVYLCLYKTYTYSGALDAALEAAQSGSREAARQAGWPSDPSGWSYCATLSEAGRFALYTLKALAFIHLRRAEPGPARALLQRLTELDPADRVGWSVVSALAQGAG